ncbi:hypothetical protein HanIR_Chr06g0261181 [Helianthus annuus]|nr:hypothetical protein HanIR_Chr06g0261181 [Helianthus annuus]
MKCLKTSHHFGDLIEPFSREDPKISVRFDQSNLDVGNRCLAFRSVLVGNLRASVLWVGKKL